MKKYLFEVGQQLADVFYNQENIKTLNQNRMKQYRVWLEDTVEEEGGTWWYCLMDANGCLFDPKYPNEERDSLEQFLQWGYKVEEVNNG
jgi:hypothetical protein